MATADERANQDTEAALEMLGFYSKLETILKRHQPFDYAPFAASQLKSSTERHDRSDFLPRIIFCIPLRRTVDTCGGRTTIQWTGNTGTGAKYLCGTQRPASFGPRFA